MRRDDPQGLLVTAVSGPLRLRALQVVRITPTGIQTRRESWFDPELTRLVWGGPRAWLQRGRGLNAS